MYSHALEQVRLTANAADYSCHGSLQICMKSAEKLEDCAACSKDNGNSVKTASCQACTAHKGICQNTYNGCSGHGDNIHPW